MIPRVYVYVHIAGEERGVRLAVGRIQKEFSRGENAEKC